MRSIDKGITAYAVMAIGVGNYRTFKQNPSEFKADLLRLKSSNKMGLQQQRCAT